MKTNSILTLAIASLLVSVAPAFCGSGIFGTGVVISSDMGGISAFNLYETTLLGDSRLAPYNGGPSTGYTLSGVPTLVTAGGWDAGGGPSLGTFTQGVDTMTLNGGELLTYKNGGDNVDAGYVYYSIDGGTFNSINLAFNYDNVPGGSYGDQRWYTDGAGINLLSGLSAGMHTLSVYFENAIDNGSYHGNEIVNNGGANYNANFAIVATPEPTTGLLVASGLGMFALIRRRR